MRRARSIRSASRGRARAASTRPALLSPPRSTRPWRFPAPSIACRSPASACTGSHARPEQLSGRTPGSELRPQLAGAILELRRLLVPAQHAQHDRIVLDGVDQIWMARAERLLLDRKCLVQQLLGLDIGAA